MIPTLSYLYASPLTYRSAEARLRPAEELEFLEVEQEAAEIRDALRGLGRRLRMRTDVATRTALRTALLGPDGRTGVSFFAFGQAFGFLGAQLGLTLSVLGFLFDVFVV